MGEGTNWRREGSRLTRAFTVNGMHANMLKFAY